MKNTKLLTLLLALVMLLALAVPVMASGEPSGGPSGAASFDPTAKPPFPSDAKIVSATVYSPYTKKPDSLQDAVIQATLYWDITNDRLYDVRFVQPMLPWDDNGADMGWACVTDGALLAALGDATVSFTGDNHGAPVDVTYAKYLQIGGIVWTGEVGSDPAAAVAMVYTGQVDGQDVVLGEYVRTPEGGEWYVKSAEEDVYFLTSPEPAASPEGANVAQVYRITYKENNGHGVFFWLSDITFPGNMEAIKEFVRQNGFDYDYYADGGIQKNEDGYWATADAVSGATLDETPTYLDLLKTLYNEIQAGNYVEEN